MSFILPISSKQTNPERKNQGWNEDEVHGKSKVVTKKSAVWSFTIMINNSLNNSDKTTKTNTTHKTTTLYFKSNINILNCTNFPPPEDIKTIWHGFLFQKDKPTELRFSYWSQLKPHKKHRKQLLRKIKGKQAGSCREEKKPGQIALKGLCFPISLVVLPRAGPGSANCREMASFSRPGNRKRGSMSHRCA